jgi:hypothetical protein
MSSTEETRAREALGRFFDEVLGPMAARLQASGHAAFPLAPEAACPTYFTPRPRPAMSRADFTAPSAVDAQDFGQRLAAHWRELGRTELLDEIPRLSALAEAAREAKAHLRENPDLPPDLYVMF